MSDANVVVLFDGECNLCNGTVRFLFRRDPQGKLKYANLQSHAGQQLLRKFSLPAEELDSFVLVEGERAFTRSSGVLRTLRYLRFPWPVMGLLLYVFPGCIRDRVYDGIAGKRYAWFGKTSFCQIPGEELQTRFLP